MCSLLLYHILIQMKKTTVTTDQVTLMCIIEYWSVWLSRQMSVYVSSQTYDILHGYCRSIYFEKRWQRPVVYNDPTLLFWQVIGFERRNGGRHLCWSLTYIKMNNAFLLSSPVPNIPDKTAAILRWWCHSGPESEQLWSTGGAVVSNSWYLTQSREGLSCQSWCFTSFLQH